MVASDETTVVPGDAHASAAAAGSGLDQHRVADLAGKFQRFFFGLEQAIGPRDEWNFGYFGDLLRFVLVAELPHGGVRRADELDVALAAHLGEIGVFREETVAGV